MKRVIRADSTVHRRIVITMHLECDEESLAAATYLEHPHNIKKKFRISEKHLEYLNDIIASFDHNIQAAGFEIVDRHPSKKGYAYYITFIPISIDGERLMPIDLVFRVADHSSKEAEQSVTSSFARIIGFTLEHEDFDKASELIYEGVRIIRELKKGNVDILDEI